MEMKIQLFNKLLTIDELTASKSHPFHGQIPLIIIVGAGNVLINLLNKDVLKI